MEEKSLPPCDLVMKGGITSGIVYPPAIVQLKEKYRFHSIGGTSAGAIAAAGTAAAEYNRQGGGFETLEGIGKSMGKQGTLLNLFQATPDTQFILDILLAILEQQQKQSSSTTGGSLWRTLKAISQQLNKRWLATQPAYVRKGLTGGWIGAGSGLLLAIVVNCALIGICTLFQLWQRTTTYWIPGLVALLILILGSWLGACVGTWTGRGWHVLSTTLQLWQTGLARNFYGICPGHTQTTNEQQPVTNLTDWLCSIIDNIAGLAPHTEDTEAKAGQGQEQRRVPLTFGALQKREIHLQMVTTGLNHGQPYILPDDLHNFIFKEDDMRQLFPRYVVEQLKVAPGQSLVPAAMLPSGYHFLPDKENLPVVFGVRLSLSFPILLSAVPLYTISSIAYQAYLNKTLTGPFDAEQHLQRNWFSDGGICSNFPIQFFDRWLPEHPTFGINLTSTKIDASVLQQADTQENAPAQTAQEKSFKGKPFRWKRQPYTEKSDDQEDVYLPASEGIMNIEWSPVTGIPTFLQAIFGAAQNYRDTLQMRLPSYRDRVVQIRLAPNEGGMALTMSPTTIQHVEQKGSEAGEILSTFQFDHHWWVRFLVLMARLEENLHEMHALCDGSDLLDIASPSLFRRRLQNEWNSIHDPQHIYPYYRDRQWCEEALSRVQALKMVMDAWQEPTEGNEKGKQVRIKPGYFFRADAPTPETVLRVTAHI